MSQKLIQHQQIQKEKTTDNHDHSIDYDNNNQRLCDCKNKPQLVTTPIDGEIVCKKCGVVMGYDEFHNMNNRVDGTHLSKIQLDICQQRQLGSDPHDLEKVVFSSPKILKIDKKNNSTLVEFTDVCKKLMLPNFVAEDAWRQFCRLKSKKQSYDSFTKAKFVCITIYQTCQNHSIPYDEVMVQEIIKKSLNVKNAPRMQNMAFKHQQFSEHQNSKNHHPVYKGLSTKSTSDICNSPLKAKFYLNLHISQAQKRHEIYDISEFRRISFQYYESFTKLGLNANQSYHTVSVIDHNSTAKRAVQKALLRCCLN